MIYVSPIIERKNRSQFHAKYFVRITSDNSINDLVFIYKQLSLHMTKIPIYAWRGDHYVITNSWLSSSNKKIHRCRTLREFALALRELHKADPTARRIRYKRVGLSKW
jgi:hypothetical protein